MPSCKSYLLPDRLEPPEGAHTYDTVPLAGAKRCHADGVDEVRRSALRNHILET